MFDRPPSLTAELSLVKDILGSYRNALSEKHRTLLTDLESIEAHSNLGEALERLDILIGNYVIGDGKKPGSSAICPTCLRPR